jgi:hypothetical protein
MKNVRKILAVVLLGLALIAGATYYGYRQRDYLYRHWYVPAYWYTQRFPWRRTKIIGASFRRIPDVSSPVMPQPTKIELYLDALDLDEDRHWGYSVNFIHKPDIILDGKAMSFEELHAALTKIPLEVIRTAAGPPPEDDPLWFDPFSKGNPHWFDDKTVYIRRATSEIIAIKIMTDGKP